MRNYRLDRVVHFCARTLRREKDDEDDLSDESLLRKNRHRYLEITRIENDGLRKTKMTRDRDKRGKRKEQGIQLDHIILLFLSLFPTERICCVDGQKPEMYELETEIAA